MKNLPRKSLLEPWTDLSFVWKRVENLISQQIRPEISSFAISFWKVWWEFHFALKRDWVFLWVDQIIRIKAEGIDWWEHHKYCYLCVINKPEGNFNDLAINIPSGCLWKNVYEHRSILFQDILFEPMRDTRQYCFLIK